MTIAETLFELVQANLAAGAAILAVLALRRPARTMFGARIAYGLWLLVPLAAVACLLPAHAVIVILAAPTDWAADAGLVTAGAAPPTTESWGAILVLALWIIGAILTAGFFASRQRRFLAEAAEGGVGPAVIGLIRPRILLPKDFEARFDPDEQRVVLAHEAAHLTAQDARINALLALAQCVCWFNPLVHVGAHALRTDQELACDAVVLARHPAARKTYAQALVKTQLAATPLPIGCYWPARSEHPLTERIAMMKLAVPTKTRRYAGASLVVLLSLGAGVAAWAAQPTRTVIERAPALAPHPAAPTLTSAGRDEPVGLRRPIRAAKPSLANPAQSPRVDTESDVGPVRIGQPSVEAPVQSPRATAEGDVGPIWVLALTRTIMVMQAHQTRLQRDQHGDIETGIAETRRELAAAVISETRKNRVQAALIRAQASLAAATQRMAVLDDLAPAVAAEGVAHFAATHPEYSSGPIDKSAPAPSSGNVTEKARATRLETERNLVEASAALDKAREALRTAGA